MNLFFNVQFVTSYHCSYTLQFCTIWNDRGLHGKSQSMRQSQFCFSVHDVQGLVQTSLEIQWSAWTVSTSALHGNCLSIVGQSFTIKERFCEFFFAMNLYLFPEKW